MESRVALRAALVLLLVLPAPSWCFDDEEMAELIQDFAKKLKKARSAEERADAARWLGGREQPEAVQALAGALTDEDAEVRLAAASALWETGEKATGAKAALTGALEDPDPRVVVHAAGALQMMDASSADLAAARRRALSQASDPSTAFLAARGLIGFGKPEDLAGPIVVYMAEQSAAAARGGSGSFDHRDNATAAREALERLLKEPNGAAAIPGLTNALARHPSAAAGILDAIAGMSPVPDEALELAMKQMAAPGDAARAGALRLASKLTKENQASRWVPEAIRLLADRDEGVRGAAVWAVRDAGGLAHEAVSALARILRQDASASLRAHAADAIEAVGNASLAIPQPAKVAAAEAARGALVEAMASKEAEVARAAVGAWNVLYLPPGEIVGALADVAVREGDAQVRYSALLCLRNRQGQARPVVDRLRPIAQGPDARVAEDARTAIEWIERGGPGSPDPIKAGAAGTAAAKSPPASAAGRPGRSESEALADLRARKMTFDEAGFQRALLEGDAGAIVAYLDAGMSPNMKFEGVNQRTPLMLLFFFNDACKQDKCPELVKAFMAHGADLNLGDEDGNTALMFAADSADARTLDLLVKGGAKVDAKNRMGITALEMGLPMGNKALEVLIAAGARLDAEKARAYLASYEDDPEVIALVKKASPQREKTKQGSSR